MKWITRLFLKMMITKAKNDREEGNKTDRVKAGYNEEIKCYEQAIKFLNQ